MSYIYGPSVQVESIEANGIQVPVRPFNPSVLFLSSGIGMGSCPYVYTQRKEGETWQNEGHILYGFNTAAKEEWDEKRLRQFSGRLLIREHDPETSYLDAVEVVVEFADGRQQRLYPRAASLRTEDGRYVSLRQGDELFLDFDPLWPGLRKSVTLRARGYYIPYVSAEKGSTQENNPR